MRAGGGGGGGGEGISFLLSCNSVETKYCELEVGVLTTSLSSLICSKAKLPVIDEKREKRKRMLDRYTVKSLYYSYTLLIC